MFFGVLVVSDGPPGNPLEVTLDPPPVPHAQAGHAVESCFHATRARGFEWPVRSIEPKVHTRGEQMRPSDVVVGNVSDRNCVAESRSRFENTPNECFARLILR